jgi:DNA-binding beta-propeller fold protein YncE
MDSSGNIFIGDHDANEVLKVSLGGTFSVFTTDVSEPTGVAFDKDGNLYVANATSNTV